MIGSLIETARVAVPAEAIRPPVPAPISGPSQNYLGLFAARTDDVLWVRDGRTGRVLYVSDAYERCWGLSREALYRDSGDWSRSLADEEWALLSQPIRNLMARLSNAALEIAYPVRAATGERWVRERAWPAEHEAHSCVVVGVITEVTEQKAIEEHQKLLLREMNHRLKNTVATIQSISNQTLAGAAGLQDYASAFAGRIQAFSRAHELLIQNDWGSVFLDEVISQTLSPYRQGAPDRVLLNGPRVLLPHGPAVALNMVFHELGTNAAKYGGLSSPSGRLLITWSVEASGSERFVNFRWEECGGPIVERPQRRGFGSRLVDRTLASLGGRAEINFSPTGLDCWIVLPLPPATGAPGGATG